MNAFARVFAGGLLVSGLAAIGAVAGGCSGGQIDLGTDNNDLGKGEYDAGTGLCGSVACGASELCCANTSCQPQCMAVAKCPALGVACPAPGTDAGPSTDAGWDPCAGKKCGDACSFCPPNSTKPCPAIAAFCDGAGTCGGTVACTTTTTLQWYTTCGDPVCRAPVDGGTATGDAGTPAACAPVGSPCTVKGQTCGDGTNTCGVVEVCDDHDPKTGGCPVSSAKFKNDVDYLSPTELQKLHDETVQTKLATYKYKGVYASQSADADNTHLGFIIEDQPNSLAVERGHDRVDLYGYVSMVVATVEVQDKQIKELQKQLAAVKASCSSKK